MKPFPGYHRRTHLMFKHGLTPEERAELIELDRALDAHKKEHPDWDPNKEPLRVSLLDVARMSARTRRTRG